MRLTLISSFLVCVLFRLSHGLGFSLPQFNIEPKGAASSSGSSNVQRMDKVMTGPRVSPLFSRYGPFQPVRSLRQMNAPLMDVSSIILPLEQRAMWRNIQPPQLRSERANNYYKQQSNNPVIYDMLVN